MNVKERDYQSKPHLKRSQVNHTKYESKYESHSLVYPDFLLFFKNVRYIVKRKFKSFTSFTRSIRSAKNINVTDSTVCGYEKGYFKTAQYNWLALIADFLGYNVIELLTINFSERDASINAVNEPTATYQAKPKKV